MQIKVTIRYHYISIRTAEMKNGDNTKCCKYGKTDLSYSADGNVKCCTWEISLAEFKKKTKHTKQPSICTSRHSYQRNRKPCSHTKL